MEFIQLSQPIPKRVSSDARLRAFPVDRIPETEVDRPFIGIYTGLGVEIVDSEAIKQIHLGGSFGLSTKTKSGPRVLDASGRVTNINQTQYERKLAWNGKFGNQSKDVVMVNLLPTIEKISNDINNKNNETKSSVDAVQNEEKLENECEQQIEVNERSSNTENVPMPMKTDIVKLEPELNIIEDPFPIEETLALSPEEAFFLHHTLRCLHVLNFDQTHELTTEEIFEQFCVTDPKLIERYVVYHYYRSKNWVVKSGIKFGGEFLLYYEGPIYNHASYVVLVSDYNDKSNHLDMQRRQIKKLY